MANSRGGLLYIIDFAYMPESEFLTPPQPHVAYHITSFFFESVVVHIVIYS